MSALKELKKGLEGKRCLYCQAEITAKPITKKYCNNSCKQMNYFKRNALRIANQIPKASAIKPTLKVIKGDLYPYTEVEKASDSFWQVCKAAFWNTQLFTEQQEQAFKLLIAEHFVGSKNTGKTFKQLVERVCLVKRYIARKQSRYVSKPIDWLNINYTNGLANTASWYQTVVNQRQFVPHYNEGISLFAEAIYNYTLRKSTLEMLYYRKELIELKQHDLVQLFMNAIMHLHYFKY
jgi:hypothetical protein